MAEPLAYTFASYRLVPSRRLLLSGPRTLKLGGRAFEVLLALIERRERTVPKRELVDLVWPRLVVEENNLQVQVTALRKLLGHDAIATIPGRGYRFALPVAIEGDGPPEHTTDIVGDARVVNPRTNLPNWLPPLFGRDEAISALLMSLDQHALVTVAGPAGVGKSRLAQRAATLRSPYAPGGVWWIDLCALTDPGLLPNAVALAIGLQLEAKSDLVQAIANALSVQETLIVLDNAEHLLDGVARFVARLRPIANTLRLLLTSQEILHGADEHVFRLDPLSLPADTTVAAAERSGAVALFVARALGNDRHFRLVEGNCAAAVDICRRLDGLPLAIELAAARVALLGIEGVRTRLDHRFQVLTSGDRTAHRRHRTLREALEWSYQLLSTQEKAVFRRLGVFSGGFTVEAMQVVVAGNEEIDCWGALEHLGELVDKSLVVAEGDPTPRYRLLESIRLFALERLIEHGEADAIRTAHRDHYIGVAETAKAAMDASDVAGLHRLDVERDNILLAMAWVRADEDGTAGLRLAVAMRLYWTSRGLVPMGLQLMQRALAHPGLCGATPARCQVEMRTAVFCSLLGQHADAIRHAGQAVLLARELEDNPLLTRALADLASAHFRKNETAEAERFGTEALLSARRVAHGGSTIHALTVLSAIYGRLGRFADARALEAEVLAFSQSEGDVRNQVVGHLNLASIAVEMDELAEAKMHLAAAHARLPDVDSVYLGMFVVRVSAGCAAAMGRSEAAVKLHAAYASLCLRAGLSEPLELFESTRLLSAQSALTATGVAQAEAVAAAWTYEDAVQHAAELLEQTQSR